MKKRTNMKTKNLLNTIAIMVHKDVIPTNIKEKLGIK